VDRVLARLETIESLVVLFAHAHLLRILAARWCGWPAADGQRLVLGAASLSVLGHEREVRVIEHWNVAPPLLDPARARPTTVAAPAANLPQMSADGSTAE
jgi:broad specificity phosphatase PhoE